MIRRRCDMEKQKRHICLHGISDAAIDEIKIFMSSLNEKEQYRSHVAIIGWVSSTSLCDLYNNIIKETGPRFVLGAIDRSLIDDEILVRVGELDLALRLPSEYAYDVDLYIDFIEGRFVNTLRDDS